MKPPNYGHLPSIFCGFWSSAIPAGVSPPPRHPAPNHQPVGMLGASLSTCQQTFLALLAFMAFFSDFPGRSSRARCSRKAPGASITLLRDGDSRVITRKKKESQLDELLHGDNVVHPLAGCCRQKFTLGCSGEVLMPRLSPAAPVVLSHGDTPVPATAQQRHLRVLLRCCKEGSELEALLTFCPCGPGSPGSPASPATPCPEGK